MSQYDGLSLSQLIDLLHGIVPPEPVPLLPATAGWWVLAGGLLALGLIALAHRMASYRANRYRREALRALDALARQEAAASQAVAVLLKRTALGAYPRHDVAALQGAAWADFLCRSSGNHPEVRAAASALAQAAYVPPVSDPQLIAAARRWIEVHRV
ncbi:MAG: DUF4381 domain-containing protein [Halieaceae bacterium]|uniref:DUF4381 domain-containing protein n=1 Tax=Haliea alexandrii TaxID=2448162 RepID=UPI000F0B3102|nr:DUF4381 domain-containing protein [Haliea alexandrii]MCR9186613.1 DUF4381 domain-containing protein [Halieaceae bacterium]